MLWRLSQLWYHDRLDPAFRGLTRERVEGIFTELGLTHGFWAMA